MANERQAQSEIKQLISKGLEQGYLTYAEVNDHLPDDLVDPEQIEDIISMINGMGIDVHEVAPDAETLLIAGEGSNRAVSYTHLDVYKRQKLPCRIGVPSQCVRRSSSQTSACSMSPAKSFCNSTCASYSSHSSASSKITHGCAARSIAAFFCRAKPSQSRCSTRAPRSRATATVSSVEPESSTITSRQTGISEAMQRPIRSPSFFATTTPVSGGFASMSVAGFIAPSMSCDTFEMTADAPLSIAHVLLTRRFAGTERHAVELANAQAAQGHDVTLILRKAGAEDRPDAIAPPVDPRVQVAVVGNLWS